MGVKKEEARTKMDRLIVALNRLADTIDTVLGENGLAIDPPSQSAAQQQPEPAP